jgi:hypothetical protein
MNEKWIHKPLDQESENKYSIYLIDDFAATKDFRFDVILYLATHNNGLIISFIASNSYSTYFGPLRDQKVKELEQKLGSGFFDGKIFFEVINSDFLQWLSKNSSTISDFMELRHFVFVDDNMFLDIATPTEEPKVTTIEFKK